MERRPFEHDRQDAAAEHGEIFYAACRKRAGLTQGRGPNYSCTTKPITPLTDVSTEEGLATIKAAIDAMVANGNTNVPEGTAWGWRMVSNGEPFTDGRPEDEKGNDKVIIVLTDGANTYSVSRRAIRPTTSPPTRPMAIPGQAITARRRRPACSWAPARRSGKFRLFERQLHNALNEQMTTLCDNAKAAKVLVMTVSLDLSTSEHDENKAIEALKKCSSDSRFRKDPTDPSKPAKLFWNATGSDLDEKFKEIADELSNLRIVG